MYQIIQGGRTDSSQNPFIVRLPANPLTGDPWDLTGLTAASLSLLNSDGTIITLSLISGLSISGSPLLGKILITLTAAQTALLAITDAETLEFSLTYSGDPVKVRIQNSYSVSA